MGDKLLTVEDLAIRWQKDKSTIRRYVSEGTITPCKGVPGTMFSPQYISRLEGVELERFSPLEKRKMQNEIDKLKIKVEKQREFIQRIAAFGAESFSLLNE